MIYSLLKWFSCVLVAVAVSASAARADETELSDRMGEMNKAFRALKKQVGDAAQNEASIKLVAQVKASAEASLKLTPEMAADLPEVDRTKFVAAYQEQMKAFIEAVGGLETALKAGDNVAATAALQKLGEMQKSGHKDYKKPE